MASDPTHDFDFFFGSWNVHHRQLKARLAGSTDWLEFAGTTVTQPLLGGQGNIDDNILDKPGGAYRAVDVARLRSEGAEMDDLVARRAHPGKLDVPMVGAFENGVGTFLADDTFDGKAIKVRFLWSRITPQVLSVGASLLRRRRQNLGNKLGDGFRAHRLDQM